MTLLNSIQQQFDELKLENEWLRSIVFSTDRLDYLYDYQFARGFTLSEAKILDCFRRAPLIVTRDLIYSTLYPIDSDASADGKVIDVFISKIRSKLQRQWPEILPIEVVWGRGYTIRPEAKVLLQQRFEAYENSTHP